MAVVSYNIIAKRCVGLESSTLEIVWIEVAIMCQKILLFDCHLLPFAGVEFWVVLMC